MSKQWLSDSDRNHDGAEGRKVEEAGRTKSRVKGKGRVGGATEHQQFTHFGPLSIPSAPRLSLLLTHTHTRMHARTHTHGHTQTQSHAHSHTHTHTHIHTHTHSDTHSLSCFPPSPASFSVLSLPRPLLFHLLPPPPHLPTLITYAVPVPSFLLC